MKMDDHYISEDIKEVKKRIYGENFIMQQSLYLGFGMSPNYRIGRIIYCENISTIK
jgi:hypothetical protein